MHAHIVGPRVATAVAVKAGNRIKTAGFEIAAGIAGRLHSRAFPVAIALMVVLLVVVIKPSVLPEQHLAASKLQFAEADTVLSPDLIQPHAG